MSAINLYVAVDWQGDREIERARGEAGRGGGRLRPGDGGQSTDGKKETRREKETERKRERKRRRERKTWRIAAEGAEGDEEEGRQCKRRVHKCERYPRFLLIEIQFESGAKPGNSEEIELPGNYRERTITARGLYTRPPFCTSSTIRNAREIAVSREQSK